VLLNLGPNFGPKLFGTADYSPTQHGLAAVRNHCKT
jgi:hypothetical protein